MLGLRSGSIGLLSLLLLACVQPQTTSHQMAQSTKSSQKIETSKGLSDINATAETRALYAHLQNIKHKHTLFGQQDALAYGFKWNGDDDAYSPRADVKDVTGSFPALVGWDLGGLELDKDKNLDGVNMVKIRAGIQGVYKRGGVNTISWHMRNPVSGGDHADKTPAVKEILPGGSKHELFKARLDVLALFNESIKVDGVYIPIIFRPWHEHNGEWFWWGKGNATEQEYIALWRFTVNYLRNEKHIHNFIFATSPDRSRTDLNNFERDYLYAYPGDEYVDIMGLDNYWDLGHPANQASSEEQLANFSQSLSSVVDIANAHHKLAALTETGSEAIPNPKFWTQVLLKGMTANDKSRQMVYVMVWRNATNGGFNGHHFYTPYPGHSSADDFVKFKQSDFVLFEDEWVNFINN
jgi:mannan endo-1,4-beta-mannosidase